MNENPTTAESTAQDPAQDPAQDAGSDTTDVMTSKPQEDPREPSVSADADVAAEAAVGHLDPLSKAPHGPAATAAPGLTESAFAVDPWVVREPALDLVKLPQTESVFALSNGHVGLRGNLDEGEPHALPGTYLNSVYELRPLPYAEAGYGYPSQGRRSST
jgi:hypothetical protein